MVMSFRLCKDPATFQALKNHEFQPYLRKFLLLFFDDILVYRSWEEILKHLEAVFTLPVKNYLFVKRTKYEFGLKEVQYLGHAISAKGVAMDPRKVESVMH